MKDIITYIKECDIATPLNTLGMGNVVMPSCDTTGSEPIIIKYNKKRKRKRKKIISEKLKIRKSTKSPIIHFFDNLISELFYGKIKDDDFELAGRDNVDKKLNLYKLDFTQRHINANYSVDLKSLLDEISIPKDIDYHYDKNSILLVHKETNAKYSSVMSFALDDINIAVKNLICSSDIKEYIIENT